MRLSTSVCTCGRHLLHESFFAIPDEDVESKLHLQSTWLLCLELDRVKMIDRKLSTSQSKPSYSFNNSVSMPSLSFISINISNYLELFPRA